MRSCMDYLSSWIPCLSHCVGDVPLHTIKSRFSENIIWLHLILMRCHALSHVLLFEFVFNLKTGFYKNTQKHFRTNAIPRYSCPVPRLCSQYFHQCPCLVSTRNLCSLLLVPTSNWTMYIIGSDIVPSVWPKNTAVSQI
jgi:hypothetical protein